MSAEKVPSASARVARTLVVLDVKPANADVDVEAMKSTIRNDVALDGLTWGEAFETVPIAFGLRKLRVQCVVVDDKVSLDDVTEALEALEDVMVVDVVSMSVV